MTPNDHREALPPLATSVRRIRDLSGSDRDRMYQLLSGYFDNVNRGQFEKDLDEKEWAIVLQDAAGDLIQGFSTLMRMRAVVDEVPVVGFFSGDTIIHPDHWAKLGWMRLWLQHVLSIADTHEKPPAYWILLTSTHKSYRFLPAFFKEFHPNPDQPTPETIQRRLDTFAAMKFPEEYDPATGVVRLANPLPVRGDYADIPPERMANRYVDFFVKANPGHSRSDFLACITELGRNNLSPSGLKLLEH